jgi:hypothetical protein
VTVAAFVLGLIGTVLATVSLSCPAASRHRRQRPKLVSVVALSREGNLSALPATPDIAELVTTELASGNPIFVGVEVINRGRLPLHVSGWFWGFDATGRAVHPRNTVGQSMPCQIEPGATATFLAAPSIFAASSAADAIAARVHPFIVCHGRRIKAEPFAAQVAAIFASTDAPADVNAEVDGEPLGPEGRP